MPYPVSAARGRTSGVVVASANWWEVAGQTCIAAYQPKGAASLAASYVNLANPGTYDCTVPIDAPTFDTATGWTFNGSTTWLNTGIVPANGYSVIARFSDMNAASSSCLVGSLTSTGPVRCNLWVHRSGSARFYGYGNNYTKNSVTDVAGVMAITNAAGYFDGSAELTTGTLGTATVALAIGARATGGVTADGRFDGKIQAVAIYSTTLSAPDVASLTTRMQNL